MIYDVISYMISVRLQLPILPRHSALMSRHHERDADLDRPMDADEERDYADQDPLSDMDMEEDAEILATLLQHIPSCDTSAAHGGKTFPFSRQWFFQSEQ
jgi:hypothetical protein